MEVLRAGTYAYLDSFTGLVPVKVMRVFHDPYFNCPMAEVRITGSRPGYPKGDTEQVMLGGLVTRNIRRRKYHTRVHPFGGFELDPQETLT